MTVDASEDLDEIARYTLDVWGIEAVEKYSKEIESKLRAIGQDSVVKKKFSKRHPNVYVTSVRYHQIFYQVRKGDIPKIIGIIHNSRNIVTHLRNRLG